MKDWEDITVPVWVFDVTAVVGFWMLFCMALLNFAALVDIMEKL